VKEPKKEKNVENIGPTTYNVNRSPIQKRVTGFVIKDEKEKRNKTAQ
jgi:hypothetical protein